MKTKFTKKGRRILSAALCLLMMITALPMSAFAWTSEEGKSCTSSFGDYYVGSDGEYYRSKATYSFIVYDSKGNITVQSINAGNAKRKYLMTDNSGTHQLISTRAIPMCPKAERTARIFKTCRLTLSSVL